MALIQFISRIQFDFGALALLPDEMGIAGIARPLIVTDAGVRDAGLLEQVTDLLNPDSYAIFDHTPGNPDETSLETCLEMYVAQDCDGLIALGGGSPIDLAKATAMLLVNGGRFQDYAPTVQPSKVIVNRAPWIAIPTTSGTGAEVGRAAVLTLHNGRKLAVISLAMAPCAIICDPDLTLSLPPAITAATGIDALSHGMETFVSKIENPPAAAIARDCVSRVASNLRKAVEDGSDREARWQMMMGALEGGMALQKSLGAAHAISLPLGERGLHHGVCIGTVLGPVFRYNYPAAPEKFDILAAAVGIKNGEQLADWISQLVIDVGLPTRLSELGIGTEDVANLAACAAADHFTATNPRNLATEDYQVILEATI